MTPLNVLVVTGGISHERDVSLRSGRRVADALEHAGCLVRVVEPDAELLTLLQENRPDVVFLALHGSSGEDGTLLGLLEALEIPYVGSPSASAMLAWTKPLARERVADAGISVPPGRVFTRDSFRELSAPGVLSVISTSQPLPLAVKPAHGGSAQGVSIVREHNDLARALIDAFTYADSVLCEQYIDGIEVAVSVLEEGNGPVALPAVEIVPLSGPYDYEARYNAGETEFFVPARLDAQVADALSDAAVRVHTVLGLRDVSRIDFIVDREGSPWFLEANAIPGMTETSLLPLALEASGRNTADVYGALAARAAAR